MTQPRNSFTASVDVRTPHRVIFDYGIFSIQNSTLARLFAGVTSPARIAVFIDSGVADHHPNLPAQAHDYVAHHKLPDIATIEHIPGGEACKNDPAVLQRVLRVMHDAKLCRHSFALAIGGGAALDLTGFAAAITHRGVRLIRVPSTTLAQADSGVGVKCGVNAFGKKNFLGSFAVPFAVVNDTHLLRSLTARDWRCGFSEAVKVALIKDADLFTRIEAGVGGIVARDEPSSLPIIQRSAELHMQHITQSGDPFETGTSRPLDFGHWAAHKLEQLADFDIRHGEAVATGLAIDVMYSHATGLLSESDRDRVITCLRSLGFTLSHKALNEPDLLLAGLDEFREHLGGELCITLLRAPGDAVEAHTIDAAIMRRAIRAVAGFDLA